MWWFPIGSPLWPLSAISTIRPHLSPKLQGVGHLGAKFTKEEVDRCKPNFNMIWERHGAVVYKRSRSISYAIWAQCTNVIQTEGQTNKPVSVEELARALPSFKQPLLSVDVRIGTCDSIERYPVVSNHANFTPPMRTSLYFKLHAAIAYVMKSAEFLSDCGRANSTASSPRILSRILGEAEAVNF